MVTVVGPSLKNKPNIRPIIHFVFLYFHQLVLSEYVFIAYLNRNYFHLYYHTFIIIFNQFYFLKHIAHRYFEH